MNLTLRYIKTYWRELVATLCITLLTIMLAYNAPARGAPSPKKTTKYCSSEVMLMLIIFSGDEVIDMGRSAIGCRCLVTIDGTQYYTAQPMDPKYCNSTPDDTLSTPPKQEG